MTVFRGRLRVAGEAVTVLFLGLISAIASLAASPLIFFPELGALACEVLTNPTGKWARSLWFLALTPALTGVIGVIIAMWMPYGFASILLSVVLCVGAVNILRSPVAPAISAGVLPVVMGLDSWLYPLAILVGTSLLAVSCVVWKRLCERKRQIAEPCPAPDVSRLQSSLGSPLSALDSRCHITPPVREWAPTLLVFIALAMVLVQFTGQRLILFPPLVVIAYEMLTHPAACPWARNSWKLIPVCVLTAAAGVLLIQALGVGVVSTMLSLVLGIVALRFMRFHVPPALAVGLIPQIMETPSWLYPLNVGAGSLLLVAVFHLHQSVLAARELGLEQAGA